MACGREHGHGEGTKFRLRVFTEIKNRGVRDALMVVCDGLKGLPDSVNAVWDKTIVQTSSVHNGSVEIASVVTRSAPESPFEPQVGRRGRDEEPSSRRSGALVEDRPCIG